MKPKPSARQPILPFEPGKDAPMPSESSASEPVVSRTGARADSSPVAVSPSASVTAPIPAPMSNAPIGVSGDARGPLATHPAPAPRGLRSYLPELFLFAAAVVVLGMGLWSVPLLDPDEARYASASRAMLERGDFVVPYFNGAGRLNKPALFYWLQGGSFRLFGTSAAAARIPSAVAALAMLVSVVLFARRTFGAEAGRRAGLILMTIPLFAIVGKTGITDMTLAVFTVGALLLWYRLHVGDRGTKTAAAPEPAGAAAPERPRDLAARGPVAATGARLARHTRAHHRLLWLGVSVCLGF